MTLVEVAKMMGKKFIVGLLVFITLISTGLIVKPGMSEAVVFPGGNTSGDTNSSTPFSGFTPNNQVAPTNTISSTSTPARSPNNVFYVSKEGNNGDGKSWVTAWNELDQIQWKDVVPGNTIMISGGEYQTSMDVGASGVFGSPITITTNGEQVVLDGQRPAPPYCGESQYSSQPGKDAIDLEGQSFIVIDGQEWRGIILRNHKRGIMMRERATNIIVRNVEIYDNGWSLGSGSNTSPDGPGVELGGSNVLFERVIIHDNGQDAFQAGWGVSNFTLRNSWLYNSREHPTLRGQPFNYCSHTDGIQIYDGGLQGDILLEKNIIGPSFLIGIMINNKAQVDNVIIKDTLFVGNTQAGIAIQNGNKSSNWTLQNVTIVQGAINESWNLKINGHGHQIRNSIFFGGPWGIGIFDWSEATENYNWLTRDQHDVALEVDPMFVDNEYGGFQGTGFAEFDFTVQNPAIPPGTGSSITSVEKLLDQKK